MQIKLPNLLTIETGLVQMKEIKNFARQLHLKHPEVPLKKIKKKIIRSRHNGLSYYKIPRRFNGGKLGLAKREILARQFEVK